MSEINANFVVDQVNTEIIVNDNQIQFTPTDIQLSIYTGAAPIAGGTDTNVQFNDISILSGSNAFTFDKSTNTVTTENFVTTSTANLGDIANITIYGGTNGYVLQTDGIGNLSWTAQTGGGGGNGVPGGANTQIQFNNAGVFGGAAGFTFDQSSNIANMPGDLNVIGTVTANTFVGNFALANVNNANYANFAGTLVNNSQPNVTSVGTLTTLQVAGNTNSGNLYSAGWAFIAANANVVGNLVTSGTAKVQQIKEKIVSSASNATGTMNFEILSGAIQLQTVNATANFTLNLRGNSTTTLDSIMNVDESLTCTFINKNGNTAYYANVIKVDSITQTVKWVYPVGAPTSGTPNAYDSYTFNVFKTAANTFTILGSKVGYQ